MAQSEQIDGLATALIKLQAMLKPALKDSDNPFFRSKYADLTSVWDAAREPMTTCGLAVTQVVDHVRGNWRHDTTETDRNSGNVTEISKQGELTSVLVTTLMHSTGQWISGVMPLYLSKADPQSQGSAITYARRYALASILGVVQEDDDGNASSGKHAPSGGQQKPATGQGYQKSMDLNLGGIYSEASNKGWKIAQSKAFLSAFYQCDEKNLVKVKPEELGRGREALLAEIDKQKALTKPSLPAKETVDADGYPIRDYGDDEPEIDTTSDDEITF